MPAPEIRSRFPLPLPDFVPHPHPDPRAPLPDLLTQPPWRVMPVLRLLSFVPGGCAFAALSFPTQRTQVIFASLRTVLSQ